MNVPVIDPTGALADPALPMLRSALQPEYMNRRLQELPGLQRSGADRVRLKAVRVRRHKPGRRCLIEYRLDPRLPDGSSNEPMVLLGKIRAKGLDRRSHEIQRELWHGGFGPYARIAVPEPLGVLPDLNMWLQRRVAGIPATQRLADPEGPALASRIAATVHKLQGTDIFLDRHHTMADELRILRRQLAPVIADQPSLAARIQRVLAASERLGEPLSPGTPCSSHRDFYADNVIVEGERLCIVDLDLCCRADPGLDIGNFIAHVTEFGLRTRRDATALAPVERALEEGYVALAGEATRPAIRVYTTLTLVRHIAISARMPERRALTPALLELCEQRLEIVNR